MNYFLFLIFIIQTTVIGAQGRYAIVIDEIMADPAPAVGLPGNEWIELKNISTLPVQLHNWRISDASGQSGPLPDFILQPDSFVIVCPGSAQAAMAAFGTSIAVSSFPALDNDGEPLILKNSAGAIIHAVSYSSSWYGNTIKKQGGWTLEMIDPQHPCSGSSNWMASIDNNGGSPGRINSINAVNNDDAAPNLKRSYTTDSVTIILVFDEPVDSAGSSAIANYSMEGRSITSAMALSPLFDRVQLTINIPLAASTVYTVTTSNITDCAGNRIGSGTTVKTGISAPASAGTIIINELLFNPRPNGYDYVELFNRSRSITDISALYLANRNNSNAISSLTQLLTDPFYLFPEEYIVITPDAANLAMNYFVKNPDAVIQISSLPSFPDDAGSVVLLNSNGEITDEVDYRDDWHFKLIVDDEGIALERIDPAGSSGTAANWHSAASTAGYGTPGYLNSQYNDTQSGSSLFEITPAVFSPDNDGVDDIAVLRYHMKEPGYVVNVVIFDATGRPVKNLVRNEIAGSSGYWNWDGLNDKGQQLPVGVYIVFTEIFNLSGKKERFKQAVVLARKLR